jgi:hypothetical protein
MVALRSLDDEWYDRAEAHGEARALAGEPDASDLGYWLYLARDFFAPIPHDTTEVDFA